MSNILGTNVILQVFTTSGSLDISGDFNKVDLKWDRNNPDVTTFGKTTVQRISGIRDYSITFAGIFNTGTNTALSYLIADMNASLNTLIKWAPGASTSGSPVFSGCFLLNTINVSGAHNTPVAMNFSAQSAAGSLTSACIP